MPEQQINFLEEISEFIFTSKYARYNEKKKRRESLSEAVDRVCKMHLDKYDYLLTEDKDKIKWAFSLVKEKKVVPSMRSMQFGGKAVFAHNTRIYNCGVRHIESLRAFAEFFYCLLGGVGMTAGVSKKVISLLPNLVNKKDKTGTVLTYVIEDTIEGWSDAVEALLMCYHKNTPFTGRKIIFDYSKIREKGTPLKTGGGKAPGHEGLKQTLEKIKEILDYDIEYLHLEKLRSIDIYDILMHCADAVLSGGIRRAATAIIFDKDDELMLNAKINFKITSHRRFEKLESGFWEGTVVVDKKKYEVVVSDYEYQKDINEKNEIGWWHIEPQRARSNNSVLLSRDKTTFEEFKNILEKTKQWGEPGFVFGNDEYSLLNPCFEVNFSPRTKDGRFGVQFCNLTSMNGSKILTIEDWKQCVEAATIIGTLQAGYTSFPYLNQASQELTEEEALLGVSLTGWFDNPEVLLNEQNQYIMAKLCVKINKDWAKKINVNQASRTTLCKPEGTSSIFLGSSSGIHPHHAHRYFRRVQMNKLDNIYQYFKMFNPHACEESVWSASKTDDVVTFPLMISEKAITKDQITAIQHLNYIRQVQENWVNPGTTEVNSKNLTHNVSCTVEVADNEWDEVETYLFENRQYFAAVALLSKSGDKGYRQAPLQRVYEEDEQNWNNLISNWNHVDYSKLEEDEDQTKTIDTVACGGGACDITSIPSDKKA
jgi:ribonucleoside-triphosphate reductase